MQDDESALARAVAMVSDLRRRCDWDRVQTRETLRPYLIEEVHELDAALASGDTAGIRDEVADLMLHLAWQLVLGAEAGEFTPDDIADALIAKMQRRHPHLFDLGPAEQWPALKARERERGQGVMAGLPPSLPELLMACRLQERAAGVGFDWPDVSGPIDKVREELVEVEAELATGADTDRDNLADEIGDLLFAVVNLARKANVQPGAALERANRKFRERFEQVDRLARDKLWDEVKRQES
jgi:MazG family protein